MLYNELVNRRNENFVDKISRRSMGTILIIDDSKPIRRLLEFILSNEGYEVMSAKDGFEAIYWLSEGHRPDLVITDIEMPNFNGEQVMSNLSNSGLFSQIPILILTGLEVEGLKEKYLADGAYAFMTKPFDPANLISVIEKAIDFSKAKIE